MHKPHIIHIQPEAPAKPELGAPCNGCGLCCLLEPCPVGVLVSRCRRGACKALLWSPEQQQYRCGMVSEAQRFLPFKNAWLLAWAARAARRMISAGKGCDAALEAQIADEAPVDPRR